MLTILLLILSQSASAKGEKILYSWGSGQGVVIVGDSDRGADETIKGYQVIWDERKDGPIPRGVDPMTASRNGKKLVADQAKIARASADAEEKNRKAQEADQKIKRRSDLKAKIMAKQATLEDISEALIYLME